MSRDVTPDLSLARPDLPKLKGTPSSRRQYTYGSGEEPLPLRAGIKLHHDQQLDLGNAVGSVLQRQVDEDIERMPPPPTCQPPPQPSTKERAVSADEPHPPPDERVTSESYLFMPQKCVAMSDHLRRPP